MRITANFRGAQVDDAVTCSDQEAVDMTYFLLHNEGGLEGSLQIFATSAPPQT